MANASEGRIEFPDSLHDITYPERVWSVSIDTTAGTADVMIGDQYFGALVVNKNVVKFFPAKRATAHREGIGWISMPLYEEEDETKGDDHAQG